MLSLSTSRLLYSRASASASSSSSACRKSVSCSFSSSSLVFSSASFSSFSSTRKTLPSSISIPSSTVFFSSPLLSTQFRLASSSSSTRSNNNNKRKSSTTTKKTKKQKAKKSEEEQELGKDASSGASPSSAAASDAKTSSKATSEASAAASSSSSSSSSLSSPSSENDDNSSSSYNELNPELEVEPMRWDTPEPTDAIVDEKGEYIVSKVQWPTGEVAYQTPKAPGPLEAKFGYSVVVVKKPQSYWSWYRKEQFFSWTHLSYQLAFAIGLAWLLTFVQLESNYLWNEMRRPGNLAGDVLGKGDANYHKKKVTVSPEERDEVLQAMQSAFLDGKDMASRGGKDYKMKKIPRPKDFKVEDYVGGRGLRAEEASI